MSEFDINEEGLTNGTETENEAASESYDGTTSTDGLTTERVVYRTYGTFDEKHLLKGANGEGSPSVLRQSKDGKNWETAAKKMPAQSENTFLFYRLTDVSAFATLIPDPEQQLYIMQKGLDAVQTAAVSSYQLETDGDNDTLKYNEEDIDLREALNDPPTRRVLSPEQKALKALSTLDPSVAMRMLLQLQAQLQNQTSPEE